MQKSPANAYRIVRALAVLRFAAVVLQAVTVTVVYFDLDRGLPLAAMLAVPAMLLLWNIGALWWLRRRRFAAPAAAVLHLGVDVAALTALLWLSGGPGSPFVSLYLLPIALAAASLPMAYAWATTGLCALLYTAMLWVAMRAAAIPGGALFHWHVVGMWVNFLIGALLLTVALGVLAGIVRRRDAALAAAREQALRDERIVATGTLAAGTAHELNTPLSTMAVLVEELNASLGSNPETAADLALLAQQIALCKQRLHGLLASADPDRHGPQAAQSLRAFLDESFSRWRLMRPEVSAEIAFAMDAADLPVIPDPTVAQSLSNLLNNAADASAGNGSNRIAVRCATDNRRLRVTIDDHGTGLSETQLETAGQDFFSTKPDGFGIGLVLSNASIARLGGEVRLFARAPGGLRTEILLPLSALRAEPARAA